MRTSDRDWARLNDNRSRPTSLAGKHEQEIRLLAGTPGCGAAAPRTGLLAQAGQRCVGMLGRCLSYPWTGRRNDQD